MGISESLIFDCISIICLLNCFHHIVPLLKLRSCKNLKKFELFTLKSFDRCQSPRFEFLVIYFATANEGELVIKQSAAFSIDNPDAAKDALEVGVGVIEFRFGFLRFESEDLNFVIEVCFRSQFWGRAYTRRGWIPGIPQISFSA